MAATKSRFASLIEQVATPAAPATPESSGEPKAGKRSDPAYRQISTYVRKDLYKSVKRELMEDDRDFGDLLEELLASWVATRKGA